jgi:hypothetical protein
MGSYSTYSIPLRQVHAFPTSPPTTKTKTETETNPKTNCSTYR